MTAGMRFFLMLLGLASLATQTAAAPSVFNNEIHYDNTGKDTGEADNGSGRIYTGTYLATDACGNNSETTSATVTVPHSKDQK